MTLRTEMRDALDVVVSGVSPAGLSERIARTVAAEGGRPRRKGRRPSASRLTAPASARRSRDSCGLTDGQGKRQPHSIVESGGPVKPSIDKYRWDVLRSLTDRRTSMGGARDERSQESGAIKVHRRCQAARRLQRARLRRGLRLHRFVLHIGSIYIHADKPQPGGPGCLARVSGRGA